MLTAEKRKNTPTVAPSEKAPALSVRIREKREAAQASALEVYRDHVTRAVAGTDTPDDSELNALVDAINTLNRQPSDFDNDVAVVLRIAAMESSIVDSEKLERELAELCERNTKEINRIKERIPELDQEVRNAYAEMRMIADTRGEVQRLRASNPRLFAETQKAAEAGKTVLNVAATQPPVASPYLK